MILLSDDHLFIACSRPRAPARAEDASDSYTFQAAAPVISSVRENARGLAADVLRDVMWPALAALLLAHVLSALAVLCVPQRALGELPRVEQGALHHVGAAGHAATFGVQR